MNGQNNFATVQAESRFGVLMQAQCLGRFRTNQRSVVPSDLRREIGQLLHPRVVGKLTIVHRRRWSKHKL